MLQSRFEVVLERLEKVNFIQGIKDKSVVVTGASSGTGEVTAVMLAQRGAKVVLAAGSFRGGKLIPTASILCGRILSFSSG